MNATLRGRERKLIDPVCEPHMFPLSHRAFPFMSPTPARSQPPARSHTLAPTPNHTQSLCLFFGRWEAFLSVGIVHLHLFLRASPHHRHADCLMPKRDSFYNVFTLFYAGCVGQLSTASIWGSLQLAASAYLLSCYRIRALVAIVSLASNSGEYTTSLLARTIPRPHPSPTVDPRTELLS